MASTLSTDRTDRRLLDGKTALVTGSSRGIGKEIALEFAAHGADVAVNFRSSRDAAESVAETIEDAGESAAAVRADIAEHRMSTGWPT